MLSGPNVSAMAEMADSIAPFGAHLVASGGVSSPSDISRLAAAGKDNICAVIVGKALYEGAAPLSAFIAAASGKISGDRR
jgi:phosphoribosylformimino-5-aminoimidazole carboxamide ribonucleotide (ProFAR) isomerase